MITLKNYLLLLTFLVSSLWINAQEVGTKIDFFGYADNREFGAPYTIPKTIFGTILSPQVYLTLENKHKLYTGIHYNQDFGKHIDNKSRVNGIMYYNYKNESIDFSLGLIPRNDKLKEIPRIILADTFMYDRPNIEGMHIQYNKNNKRQALYIDWLSKQSYSQREQFIVGTSGLYKWGKFYFSNDGLLYHNALTSNDSIDEHIQDNFVFKASLGLDLSKTTFLDSLTVDVGGVFGFDRLRTEYENNGTGFLSNLYLGYKSVFVKNTLYLGNALNLPNADPFYHRKKYDRLDIGWIPFKSKNIDGKFTASFHFREGGMDNQQSFTIRYTFDQRLWKK